jgi:hypothetical protein
VGLTMTVDWHWQSIMYFVQQIETFHQSKLVTFSTIIKSVTIAMTLSVCLSAQNSALRRHGASDEKSARDQSCKVFSDEFEGTIGCDRGGYGGCSPGAHSSGGPEIRGPHCLQCISSNNLTFQFIVLIYQNSKK